MKISRFSEPQIVAILKQTDDGIKVKDLCREHDISDTTNSEFNIRGPIRTGEKNNIQLNLECLVLRGVRSWVSTYYFS